MAKRKAVAEAIYDQAKDLLRRSQERRDEADSANDPKTQASLLQEAEALAINAKSLAEQASQVLNVK